MSRKKKSFDLYQDVSSSARSSTTTGNGKEAPLKGIENQRTDEEVSEKWTNCKDLEKKIAELESKRRDACEMIETEYLRPIWRCITYMKDDIEAPFGVETEIKDSNSKFATDERYEFTCDNGKIILEGHKHDEPDRKQPPYDFNIKITLKKTVVLDADYMVWYSDNSNDYRSSMDKENLNVLKLTKLNKCRFDKQIRNYERSLEYEKYDQKENDLKDKLKKLKNGMDFR